MEAIETCHYPMFNCAKFKSNRTSDYCYQLLLMQTNSLKCANISKSQKVSNI